MKKDSNEILREKIIFKLSDAIFPDAETLFANITGDIEIVGKVSFVSSGIDDKERFLIVEVPGMLMPVIVPKDKVKLSSLKHKSYKNSENQFSTTM